MKKYALLLWLMGLVIYLPATLTFYPTTVLAEDFGATWCQSCPFANAGMDVLHGLYQPGDFISARYYTQSAELSNPEVETRFQYYAITELPHVYFNGVPNVEGATQETANGDQYDEIVNPLRFRASPVKMSVNSFNATTGAFSVRVTMLKPNYILNNAHIRFLLLENNLTTITTHVTRSIISQPIAMAGGGSYQDFNVGFTLNAAWATVNLWAAAFIQLNDATILQSVSTLLQPNY